MRRRITLAILAVTTIAVTVFGVPLALVVDRLYLADARTKLEREATLMARDIPSDFATATDPIDLPSDTKGIRVALYGLDGSLVSGDGPPYADRTVLEAVLNTISSHENGDQLTAGVPVAVNERVVGVVRAETSTHAAEHRAHIAWVLMAAFGVLVVALAGGLAVVEANRLTRPLRRVRDAAVRLGDGDYDLNVPRADIAELDELASALAATGGRLGQAMQRERELTTHVSHQLRTPIAGLRLAVETELTAPRPDPTLALQECLGIAERLDATVNELMRLAREPRRAQKLSIGALLERIRTNWHGPLANAGRRLHLPTEPADVEVFASDTAVGHALDILLDNAVRHGRGTVSVNATAIGGGLVLSVTDEGPGPAAAQGDGSMTTGDGHGIGLELAATLIGAEGGRLRRPTPDNPATFAIVLIAATPMSTQPVTP